jgi:hypothetical protein
MLYFIRLATEEEMGSETRMENCHNSLYELEL